MASMSSGIGLIPRAGILSVGLSAVRCIPDLWLRLPLFTGLFVFLGTITFLVAYCADIIVCSVDFSKLIKLLEVNTSV